MLGEWKSNRHILHSFVRKKLQAFLCERFLSLCFFCQRWLLTGAIYSLKRYSRTSSRFFIANFRGNFQHHAIFMILIFSLTTPPLPPSSSLALARGSFCTFLIFPSLAPSFFHRHSQCRSSLPFPRRIIMLFLLSSLFFLVLKISSPAYVCDSHWLCHSK